MDPAGDPPLSILGVGSHRPALRRVRDLARAAGADDSAYEGWEVTRVAGDDEHPSGMAAQALSEALKRAGISSEQLSLVVSCGVSRDYLPSWSVAMEVIRVHEIGESCFGLDVTLGCLGALLGLEIAHGWLRSSGGGYAAVVTAERWTDTIDRSRLEENFLWGYADGAAAAVVALDRPEAPLAVYRGACFSAHPAFNGAVLMKYGGTRFPVPPAGERPFVRQLQAIPKAERIAAYRHGTERLFAALRERYAVKADWLVCVQPSPNMVEVLRELAVVDAARVCRTGETNGHMGAGDILIGLEDLLAAGQGQGNVFLAASSPYAFGAGLVEI